MSGFKPPAQFDFREPQGWSVWRALFQRFHTATELSKKSEEVQVSCLIYSMGPEAEKIFSTFGLSEEDGKNYATVLGKYNDYFTPKRNIIHERATFHRRDQKDTETVEEYVRALYDLSQYAEFQDRDNTIRDRLVLGLVDRELSEKLQLESNLTLATAITMSRQSETVKKQLHEQRHSAVDTVHAFRNRRGGASRDTRATRERERASEGARERGREQASHPQAQDIVHECKYCGGTHSKRRCPAYGKICHRCKKKNHFARVCRKAKDVAEVRMGEKKEDEAFLFSLKSQSYEEPWKTEVTIGRQKAHFKIDTGADVSVMTVATFNSLKPRPKLEKTGIILRSPGGVVECLGKVELDCTVRGSVYPVTVYVASSSENLLSREAASRMGLVVRLDNVFGELDETPIHTTPVKIQLQEGAQPYSVHTARRIPIPLLGKVKEELQKMERVGIIKKVDEPTDWCAPIVPVIKPSGSVRICTDFKKLNEAVKRERYMLPAVEDVLHRLKGSSIFSKLDARSGFFQVPLDESSAKLTTFITPEGRYYYQRLPQGITSAPEIFQKTMESILGEQQNVICFFDDILVHSKNAADHEIHLNETLRRLHEAGVKLGKEKCQFRQSEIKFLGSIISKDGVRPDPDKTAAIVGMSTPSNVTELRRILGMINFLGRHLPNLSTVINPLSELLEKDRVWSWGPPQEEAFKKVKELVTSAPTLAFFDPDLPTSVSADASSYGLGAVLLQTHEEGDRPVAYASRTLSKTEKQYAQIEKECLASTWACERFEKYLIGLPKIEIVTDHKPLVPLINTKDLSETPMRCQRMLLRLLKFSVKARYVPGKEMTVADTLSRSPTEGLVSEGEHEVAAHVREVTSSWNVKDATMERIKEETKKDIVLQTTMRYTTEGWPQYKEDVQLAARPFYALRGELSIYDGLLLRGSRILIPESLRKEMLEKVHLGHMGITKCRERAAQSIWWPQIGSDIKDRVASCRHCLEKQPSYTSEPLLPTKLPDRPFQKVAVDLFTYKSSSFLVMTDYYSRYKEICYLPNETASTVIGKMKSCFARYGIPETVVSDNGPYFTSAEFRKFAASWNFQHMTSSPHYPRANGAAENAVKTAKQILRQDDAFLALLSYRATPIPELGVSPAELLMGRKLRTTLPSLPSTLQPRNVNDRQLRERDDAFKEKQKFHHDRHRGAQPLPELSPGDPVLVKLDEQKGWKLPAEVVGKCAPRSYTIQTPTGKVRRNRRHLRRCPGNFNLQSHSPMPFSSQTGESQAGDSQPAASGGNAPVPAHQQRDQQDESTTQGCQKQHSERSSTPGMQSGPVSPQRARCGPASPIRTRSGRAIIKPDWFKS